MPPTVVSPQHGLRPVLIHVCCHVFLRLRVQGIRISAMYANSLYFYHGRGKPLTLEQFKHAIDDKQNMFEQILGSMSLGVGAILGSLVIAALFLCLFFAFIFQGIVAFTEADSFGAVINSMLVGFGGIITMLQTVSKDVKQDADIDTGISLLDDVDDLLADEIGLTSEDEASAP